MKVTVLYFPGCPGYRPTVELVSRTMKELGISADLELREINDEPSARAARFLGSPTVQVNGKDIEKERRGDAPVYGCRIYKTIAGHGSVPSRELITAAFNEALANDDMDGFVIRKARPQEIARMKQMLLASNLPFEDIDAHVDDFLAAEMDDELVGLIGIEIRGKYGLLRSLVVQANYRKKSIGARLLDEMIAYATAREVAELYLLTTTAKDFFLKHGFTVIARDASPATIRETMEFSTICPSTSVCMKRTLPG